MRISDNKYVTVTYDLNVGEEDERELMEQATAQQPMEFIFGVNTMLKAFEDRLRGLSPGDTFSFQLTPEEAYGDYDDARVVELPKNIFKVDGEIDEVLFEGHLLPMEDSVGNKLIGSVVSVGDDMVTMDFNHPLAGETLYFDGTVEGVREASAEEIAALFSGGGCGCDCCCSSGENHADGCDCDGCGC
jgi:FKBP-type peptidyl-prolyl cis-trans isomerase SlyD